MSEWWDGALERSEGCRDTVVTGEASDSQFVKCSRGSPLMMAQPTIDPPIASETYANRVWYIALR